MAYTPRFLHSGAVYHVTGHAVGDEPAFRTLEDRDHFDGIIGHSADLLGVKLLMYCQMTDHHHLLVETPYGNLDAFMHRVHGMYARGYNERHDRRGHLFRERYRCWFVQTEMHFFRTVRYIALNPVKAGMCRRPERYRWGNYGSILRAGRAWPAFAQNEVTRRCGGEEALRAFVEEALRARQWDDDLELLAA